MRRALFIVLLLALFPLGAHAADNGLLIGLIPEENIFRQVQRHRPLEKYLSERLGIEVKFTILSRYGDIIDRFNSRAMDGAFFDIFTALIAREKLGVEPLVRPVNLDGSWKTHGLIFTRKDSGINNVRDMEGTRVAFVDKATAAGYVFGLAYFRENGIRDIDKYLREYYFTGSHDSALFSVLDGRADLGVAKDTIVEKFMRKDPLIKEELHILAESIELPETTLCVKADLDAGLKRKLKAVLLGMHNDPDGAKALESLEALRFMEAGPEDFKDVEELAGKAGIVIKDYEYR